jgi:hypothetical protein
MPFAMHVCLLQVPTAARSTGIFELQREGGSGDQGVCLWCNAIGHGVTQASAAGS